MDEIKPDLWLFNIDSIRLNTLDAFIKDDYFYDLRGKDKNKELIICQIKMRGDEIKKLLTEHLDLFEKTDSFEAQEVLHVK